MNYYCWSMDKCHQGSSKNKFLILRRNVVHVQGAARRA
jgi:hypothetical protein